MRTVRLLGKNVVYAILLMAGNFLECWTVKILNLTDEKITVNIQSSQKYAARKSCEFIGKQVDPHAWYDFHYKDINPICMAPCTKLVTITSPVQLAAKNTLTSCSNVIVTVRKDESDKWIIEYHDWTDDILKMIAERTRMPIKVRELYDKLGNSPIRSISVFRQSIAAGIRELIEIITNNELRHLNYDKIYHTGFIIECQDNIIRLERNQTVSSDIEIIKSTSGQGLELKNIDLSRTIRYNEFISKAMENDPKFWQYNPVTRNCQLFVLQCLEKNNIEIPDDLRAFIYQDAEKILENHPLLKAVAETVTSLANRIDNIVMGGTKELSKIETMVESGAIKPSRKY